MNRLKKLRQQTGDTQEDVAKVIGVTRRGYQKMENEESQIKSDKAQKLAKYFGVSVGYLLGYEPESEQVSNYQKIKMNIGAYMDKKKNESAVAQIIESVGEYGSREG